MLSLASLYNRHSLRKKIVDLYWHQRKTYGYFSPMPIAALSFVDLIIENNLPSPDLIVMEDEGSSAVFFRWLRNRVYFEISVTNSCYHVFLSENNTYQIIYDFNTDDVQKVLSCFKEMTKYKVRHYALIC